MTDISAWIDTTFAGFDHALLQALHSLAEWGGSVLTPIFLAVSAAGEYGIFVLVLAAVLLFFRKTRKAGICIILAVCIGAVLTNLILKDLIARPRPYEDISSDYFMWWHYVGAVKETDFSFPSGHVTAVMAGMTALFLSTDKRISWIGFVLVALMALSRCYLMVHYPSDTLAAMVVGALAAVLAYFLVEKVWRLRASKKSPQADTLSSS